MDTYNMCNKNNSVPDYWYNPNEWYNWYPSDDEDDDKYNQYDISFIKDEADFDINLEFDIKPYDDIKPTLEIKEEMDIKPKLGIINKALSFKNIGVKKARNIKKTWPQYVLNMNTREINVYIKNNNLNQTQILQLKLERRRMLNCIYARNSREKKGFYKHS